MANRRPPPAWPLFSDKTRGNNDLQQMSTFVCFRRPCVLKHAEDKHSIKIQMEVIGVRRHYGHGRRPACRQGLWLAQPNPLVIQLERRGTTGCSAAPRRFTSRI